MHSVKGIRFNMKVETFYAFEKELEEFADANENFQLHVQVYITGPSDPEETYSIPNNLTFVNFTASCRPNYNLLMKEIEERTDYKLEHVVGVCAHDATLICINNLALQRAWHIRKERFEF